MLTHGKLYILIELYSYILSYYYSMQAANQNAKLFYIAFAKFEQFVEELLCQQFVFTKWCLPVDSPVKADIEEAKTRKYLTTVTTAL